MYCLRWTLYFTESKTKKAIKHCQQSCKKSSKKPPRVLACVGMCGHAWGLVSKQTSFFKFNQVFHFKFNIVWKMAEAGQDKGVKEKDQVFHGSHKLGALVRYFCKYQILHCITRYFCIWHTFRLLFEVISELKFPIFYPNFFESLKILNFYVKFPNFDKQTFPKLAKLKS